MLIHFTKNHHQLFIIEQEFSTAEKAEMMLKKEEEEVHVIETWEQIEYIP